MYPRVSPRSTFCASKLSRQHAIRARRSRRDGWADQIRIHPLYSRRPALLGKTAAVCPKILRQNAPVGHLHLNRMRAPHSSVDASRLRVPRRDVMVSEIHCDRALPLCHDLLYIEYFLKFRCILKSRVPKYSYENTFDLHHKNLF